MSDVHSRLELLPNEIFLEIFQYFDASDTFRMFYDLNIRFKRLLQSLIDLSISRKIMHADIDPLCVQSLTSDQLEDINLKNYSNLRHLKLDNMTLKQMDQFDSIVLRYLEHLCIYPMNRPRLRLDIFDEYNPGYKIFSNGYPNLMSCSLVNVNVILMTSDQIASPKLRYLRVGPISFRSYQEILSACPNLDFLRFNFPSFGGKILPKSVHLNLRRMIIDFDFSSISLGEFDIEEYFSCIPNLEQLRINQEKKDDNISHYLTSKWFAKPIENHLSSLRRFKFQLRIFFIGDIRKRNGEDILDHLEASFNRAHNYRYHSKLIFVLHS